MAFRMTERDKHLPDLSGPAGTAPACRAPDPLGIIAEEHALQRELCDLLEALADGLPHNFDKGLAEIAVALLEGSVPSHMQLEETMLFPKLRERITPDDPLHAAMHCLEEEHDRDSALLMEMIDALKTAISDGVSSNANMLGYLLRGYFDSQRRHIAWEDRVVLPAARQALRPDDLAGIQSWIMASNHPRCSHQSVLAIRRARSAQCVCDTCPEGYASEKIIPFSSKHA